MVMKTIKIYFDQSEKYECLNTLFRGFIKINLIELPDLGDFIKNPEFEKINELFKNHLDSECIKLLVLTADKRGYLGIYPYDFRLPKNITLNKKVSVDKLLRIIENNEYISFHQTEVQK